MNPGCYGLPIKLRCWGGSLPLSKNFDSKSKGLQQIWRKTKECIRLSIHLVTSVVVCCRESETALVWLVNNA